MALSDTGSVPLIPTRTGSAQLEVKEGGTVHVSGHGPAVVVGVSGHGKTKYQVRYPDGSEEHISRDQILAAQALPPVDSTQRRMSLAGPASPQMAPRQVEYLSRAFDDSARIIRTPSATFSLVATMVGGGVLSLPYAMSQCGLALGTIALIVSAVLSGWTLDMLVQAARSTGCDSFELVGYAAFGEKARKMTVWIIFLICWLSQIAYFVLLADLLQPTIELAGPHLFQGWSQAAIRKVVVSIAACILAPMCFKSNLSALSFMCFASVGSVVFVGIVIGVRALNSVNDVHEIASFTTGSGPKNFNFKVELRWWPEDWLKALYVFPMFGVSFLCHFNALPTHQELQRPTRQRIRRVLLMCMGFTSVLYLFVSITGYLWAGSCTCGNILLNFDKSDRLVAVGRGALGLVLMLNFPLLCQPCRNSLFRLISPCLGQSSTASATAPGRSSESLSMQTCAVGGRAAGPAQETAIVMVEEEEGPASTDRTRAPSNGITQVASPQSSPQSAACPSSPMQVHAYRREDTRGMMSVGATVPAMDRFSPKDETVLQSSSESTAFQRHMLTTLILISTLLVSMFMGSILVVWSIVGSTVAFMIGFIMPAAFWLQLVGQNSKWWKVAAAKTMLISISIIAVACTVLTILNLSQPACPKTPSTALL